MSMPDQSSGQGSVLIATVQNIVSAINGLVASFRAAPASTVLTVVGVPTNANAAAAGVAVGQQYRDTADPSKVYVRTV